MTITSAGIASAYREKAEWLHQQLVDALQELNELKSKLSPPDRLCATCKHLNNGVTDPTCMLCFGYRPEKPNWQSNAT